MALTPGTQIGPYEIRSGIGAGGMGEVFRARDTKLNRDVAIKVLPAAFADDPERLARFNREAQTLASLNHPNIATIYGIEELPKSGGSGGGSRALVMELVEGEDLSAHLARGPMPIAEALPIARQIAEALEAAHEQGIVHRDLKPANIKVRADGTVKVLDFGLAKAMDQGGGSSSNPELSHSPTLTHQGTSAGMIIGTAAYMSPEQAKGKAVDKRTDIWAFGVVLYEMLSGKRAFRGDDVSETLASVLKDTLPMEALPAAPPALRRLIERCLDRDLKTRLRDIGEARIEIARIETGGPDAAPVTSASAIDGSSKQVRALSALVAFLGLAVVATFLAWKPWRTSLSSTPPPEGRFTVTLPGNSAQWYLTLSPDGTALAFVSDASGVDQIWIRPLDGLEAKPLAGTDGASYPFWSPDSRKLGFFARGKLRKIAAEGGPVEELCDAPSARGGTWNRDGVIVFAPTVGGGLFQVRDQGGEPRPVTLATARQTHRYPSFIAGGNHFLFVMNDVAADATAGLHVGSLDGTPPVRLLSDQSKAQYVPPLSGEGPGVVLFVRQRTAMALPFDAESLRPTGEARVVARDVDPTGGHIGFSALSASDNGVLVYRTGSAQRKYVVASFDRTGRQLSVLTDPRPFTSFTMSPNGRQMCLAVRDEGLWVQKVGQKTPEKFGAGDSCVWTPQGHAIVFGTGTFSPLLARKSVATAEAEETLWQAAAASNTTPLDISPDGKWLAYSSTGSSADGLWLLPLDGDRQPVKYLDGPGQERQAQFSPDGKWLAYSSDETGQTEVYVQPIPATGSPQQISPAGGSAPRWLNNGRELYYLSVDGQLVAVPITLGAGTLERGSPRQLTTGSFLKDDPNRAGGSRVALYQPSPDGQTFLALVPAGDASDPVPPLTVRTNWRPERER